MSTTYGVSNIRNIFKEKLKMDIELNTISQKKKRSIA